MRLPALTSLSLAALALLACPRPSEDDEGDGCDPDFDQIRAEILEPHCTSEFCHDADEPAAELDLTGSADAIATQLIDVPSTVCADWVRVVPGDSVQSIFVAKLHDPPPCGERMPIDDELSDDEVACLERWITEIGQD